MNCSYVLNHIYIVLERYIRSAAQNLTLTIPSQNSDPEKVDISPHKIYYAVLPPLVDTHLKILAAASVTVSLWEKKVKVLFLSIRDFHLGQSNW